MLWHAAHQNELAQTELLLLDARAPLHEVLVRWIACGPAVEADYVNVACVGFACEPAVDLSCTIYVQLVAKLRCG